MASTINYRDFILEQLRDIGNIDCRPMMGEYLLYHQGVLFGGIYDNRLLIKKTTNNKQFNLPEEIPYDTAKSMYMIEDIDNRDLLKDIVIETYYDLKKKD